MTSSIIEIVISACHYDNETQNESIQLRCCYGHHHFQQYFLKVDNDGTAFTPSMGGGRKRVIGRVMRSSNRYPPRGA